MFMHIKNVLNAAELAELRRIAATAQFVDGRISAPGATVKNNLAIGEREAMKASAKLVADALYRSEDFRVFAFPKVLAPPVLTSYRSGMAYGVHTDAAFMPLGPRMLRSDLSCTLFVSEPDSYEGGALHIRLGSGDIRFRGEAGSAIVYPSTTLHEVEPVTSGERLVALTFIESRIKDPEHREWLFELNEVAAIAGEKMDLGTFTRLQRVQQNLLRHWGDQD
jgi:PKHD-type hydroxylase